MSCKTCMSMFLSSLCYGRRSGDRLFFRIDAGSLLLVATTYVTFARYIINAWKPAICFHRRSVTFRVAPPRRATQRTHCLRRKANISHQSASHWTTPPAAYASQQHVCIASRWPRFTGMKYLNEVWIVARWWWIGRRTLIPDIVVLCRTTRRGSV